MQNTLLSKSIIPLISSWKDFHDIIINTSSSLFKSEIKSNIHIQGAKGSLRAFFLQQMLNRYELELKHLEHIGFPQQFRKDFFIIASS